MTEPKESTGVQAVLFALEILEHVAVQREPIGVGPAGIKHRRGERTVAMVQ